MITPSQKKELLKIKGMKELKKEFDRQIKGSGKKKGPSFWSKLSKTVGDVNKFLKDTKIISKTGKVASAVLPFTPLAEFTPVPLAVSAGAEALGYGKKTMKPKGKLMIGLDGKFTRPSMPTKVPLVVGRRALGTGSGHIGRGKVKQGTFGTISSDFGKVKF